MRISHIGQICTGSVPSRYCLSADVCTDRDEGGSIKPMEDKLIGTMHLKQLAVSI